MHDKHIKKEETTDWASKTGQTHLLIEDHVIQKLNLPCGEVVLSTVVSKVKSERWTSDF